MKLLFWLLLVFIDGNVLAAKDEYDHDDDEMKCGQLSCGRYCKEQDNRTAPHNTCQCRYGKRPDNETGTCVWVSSCEQSLYGNSTIERCEHICKNIYVDNRSTYICNCYPGYERSANKFGTNVKCKVTQKSAVLYYSSGCEIRGFNVDTKDTFSPQEDILTERAGGKITAILRTEKWIYYALSWIAPNNHSYFSLHSVSLFWVLCKDRFTIAQ